MFYLVVIAALLWEWLARPKLFASSERRGVPGRAPAGSLPATAAMVAGVVVLYAAQLAVIAMAAFADLHGPKGSLGPFAVLDDRGQHVFSQQRTGVALTVLVIVCLESTLLYALSKALTEIPQRAGRTLVVVGGAGLIVLSLVSPALLSGDLYLYVGYSLLLAPYAPAPAPFAGEFAPINAWWGTPLLPSPYGPLFVTYVHWLLAAVPTLFAKIETLRLANACWFIATVWLLRRAGAPRQAVALVALNPALVLLFIANGHNDIVGVALIVAAFALARRSRVATVLLTVAASLIKLPLALVALPAFSPMPKPARFLAAAFALAGCVIAAATFGGQPYFRALHLDLVSHIVNTPQTHVVLIGIAVAAIAVGLFADRWLGMAAFSLPALASRLFPWYALWGLPYSVAAGRLAGFCIALPLATYLMESCFDTRIVKFVVLLALFALALVAAARSGRLKLAFPFSTPARAAGER